MSNTPGWIEVAHARPGPFKFPLAHTALVIIDMQRDFVEPGGFGEALGNDVSPLMAIVPALRTMLEVWRTQGALVIHTLEGHPPDMSDCPPSKLMRGAPSKRIGDVGPMGRILIQGEVGHGIIDDLRPQAGEWVIDKPGKGMFYATGLHERLQTQGITHLLFGGVTTEVCVQTSMREANDRGYECLLLTDCTESYFPEFRASTIEMMCAQGGIIGWVAPSSELLGKL